MADDMESNGRMENTRQAGNGPLARALILFTILLLTSVISLIFFVNKKRYDTREAPVNTHYKSVLPPVLLAK